MKKTKKYGYGNAVAALMTVVSATIPLAVNADTIEINGVTWTYSVKDASSKSLILGNGSVAAMPTDTVLNAADIPWTMTIGGETYTVVELAANAFYLCGNLTGTLTVPQAVTKMGNAAFASTKLSGIASLGGVTTIGQFAFNNSGSTLSCNMPDLSRITSFGNGVFQNCNKITGSVVLGQGLTTIPNRVFFCCSFTDIMIPNSVTSIADDAFRGCSSLVAASLPDSVTSVGNEAFWGAKFATYAFPRSVTSIGNSVFRGCTVLTAAWIPGPATVYSETQTYTTINGNNMFMDAPKLKLVLFGSNTKPSNKSLNMNKANGCKVFVPDNGFWNELAPGGSNTDVVYYHGFDERGKKMTFTPTTAAELINVLDSVAMFKDKFDLDVSIAVTNTIELAEGQVTAAMLSGLPVKFDSLLFSVKNQAQLNNILGAFPSSAMITIDPTGLTEKLTVPEGRRVFVQLSEGDDIRQKLNGFIVIVK